MTGEQGANNPKKLDHIFWQSLTKYLSDKRENIPAAPRMGNSLNPVEMRHMQAWYKAHLLVRSGVDKKEARRQAFEEFYPDK